MGGTGHLRAQETRGSRRQHGLEGDDGDGLHRHVQGRRPLLHLHGRHVQALVNPTRYPLTMKGVGQRKKKNNDRKSHSNPSAFFSKKVSKTLVSCSEISCCTCKTRERRICENKRRKRKKRRHCRIMCAQFILSPLSRPESKTKQRKRNKGS